MVTFCPQLCLCIAADYLITVWLVRFGFDSVVYFALPLPPVALYSGLLRFERPTPLHTCTPAAPHYLHTHATFLVYTRTFTFGLHLPFGSPHAPVRVPVFCRLDTCNLYAGYATLRLPLPVYRWLVAHILRSYAYATVVAFPRLFVTLDFDLRLYTHGRSTARTYAGLRFGCVCRTVPHSCYTVGLHIWLRFWTFTHARLLLVTRLGLRLQFTFVCHSSRFAFGLDFAFGYPTHHGYAHGYRFGLCRCRLDYVGLHTHGLRLHCTFAYTTGLTSHGLQFTV